MRSKYAIRWSDHDRYFGPITYARDRRDYRPLAVELSSGDGDDYPGCRLRVSAFGHTGIIALPPIIKPHRRWVDTSRHGWSKGPGSGYWDLHNNTFGASLVEGAIHFQFGAQTHDSRTDKTKCWFLPWRQHRHIRHTLFGLEGEHVADLPQYETWLGRPHRWNVQQAIIAVCPTAQFEFSDYDGERLIATTRIEEREWVRGVRWWKWLALITRNRVSRSLDIQFSGETGERKGSWKGGTIGHSIELLPSELHEAAFARYCTEHKMAFLGPITEPA